MIEKTRLEQAALYAVDLLDPTEQTEFARELHLNRELQRGVRELQDVVAAVSRLAPQHEPPALRLDLITASRGTPKTQKISPSVPLNGHASNVIPLPEPARRLNFNRPPVLPWAAAAACAVLAAWFASQSYLTQRQLRELQANHPNHQGPNKAKSTQGPPESTPDQNSSVTGTVASPDAFTHRDANGNITREVRLIQDRDRLQKEIEKIQCAHAAQAQPQEGVLQMKLVELRAPNAPVGTGARQLLDRITDAVSASLPKTEPKTPPPPVPEKETPPPPATPPPPPKPPKVSAHGVGTDQELEISGPVNLAALNLHPDQRIVYRDGFPTTDYQEISTGVWYDENRNFVWRQRPDGSVVGQQPPPNWTPESEAPPLRTPPVATPDPVDPQPVVANTPATPTPAPAIESWTFVDGPRGDGTIIVQNLPKAPTGQVHALWSQETLTAQPVFRGYFPDLPNGNGMISFSLPPGTPPATFLVTTEAASPNASSPAAPSNRVILIGP